MKYLQKIFTGRNILYLLIIVLLINLLYIDYIIYKNGGIKSEVKTVYQTNLQSPIVTPEISLTQTPTPTSTPKPVTSSQGNTTQAALTKEYYIPFGAGSSTSTDWQDVPGLQAYIDSTAYQNISRVIFEASAHIPTGNETAGVRLINATDGRVIAGSELTFNGNTSSVFLSSSPTSLDYANKLYKIQMKTQLGYEAILDQSRVHIITK